MVNAACSMADDTDTPFTKEELEGALAKTKNTAPGIDDITYSMLRNMGVPAKRVYLLLINKTYVERCRPLTWNQQNIQPIPKPQEENACRPIALISCMEKVAERMVINRLKWKVGKLHPRLYGFTEGIGTHECIVDVMAAVNNRKALVAFIDLEKAYELASAQAILFSLVGKRVRGHRLSASECLQIPPLSPINSPSSTHNSDSDSSDNDINVDSDSSANVSSGNNDRVNEESSERAKDMIERNVYSENSEQVLPKVSSENSAVGTSANSDRSVRAKVKHSGFSESNERRNVYSQNSEQVLPKVSSENSAVGSSANSDRSVRVKVKQWIQ
ncbi:probable serine/threonine-protein kinase DDB_G0277165 [Palaemon carinicauda]|uniref:probable serine/threonine-protein kinase DDB_G0277165 n=1 Tax=Palaemon carinicauda TaxID=392227 RepID=UPI0035B5A545